MLGKKSTLTKVLAITGTVLVWFPILAPILLSVVARIVKGRFLFDYLIPMELFLFTLIGSGLLLWSTLRAHSRVKFIVWGFGIAVFMFFGIQGFAEITGMASGETEPAGWMWIVVIGSLITYAVGIILVGVGGTLLIRDLLKKNWLAV